MVLGILKIYLGSPFSANWCCPRSVCSRSVGSRSGVVDPDGRYVHFSNWTTCLRKLLFHIYDSSDNTGTVDYFLLLMLMACHFFGTLLILNYIQF